jgi:hypothetical protein
MSASSRNDRGNYLKVCEKYLDRSLIFCDNYHYSLSEKPERFFKDTVVVMTGN